MPVNAKIIVPAAMLLVCSLLTSCSSLSYYGQSVSGQIELLRARQSFRTLLHSPDTPDELKSRLKSISRIREFASASLGLPDNNSYLSYADIGRKYIVWNVFAAPPLSFEPKQSCFLIVGCLSYRGYFNKQRALTYAESLKDDNLDVYLGGVIAYSTLGWFNDPILNGMLERNDTDLARLIFHELAHQQMYISNDTEFNEAFADAVALIGLEYWLDEFARPEQKKEVERQLQRENQFIDLVLSYRQQLDTIYRSESTDAEKYLQKAAVYTQLQQAYAQLRADWGGYAEYDAWFKHDLNNAKLAALSTYRNLVPGFLNSFSSSGNNISVFYSRITTISHCDFKQRRELLYSEAAKVSCN
jgi:predicted aminopeptidase